MCLHDYLGTMREPVPEWLARFRAGDAFQVDAFLSSRVVYYPGSGTDGQPVRLFGSTHSAHCFIYADYGLTQEQIEQELNDQAHGFLGYRSAARLSLTERDVAPAGWIPHAELIGSPVQGRAGVATAPYGFLEVLERIDGFGDDHGASRLCILFLGADGIAAYDALFCQRNGTPPPFAVVLQDHVFGGNYDSFGADGALARAAALFEALPSWLLVAENTTAWRGYEQVPDLPGEIGGRGAHLRFLYRRG